MTTKPRYQASPLQVRFEHHRMLSELDEEDRRWVAGRTSPEFPASQVSATTLAALAFHDPLGYLELEQRLRDKRWDRAMARLRELEGPDRAA